MPNIAAVLKEEIRRLSRREIGKYAAALRSRVTTLSRAAALQKRRVAELEKKVARLRKVVMADRPAPIAAQPEDVKKARLGPRSIKAQRRRLKLTQAQYAKLIGVSSPTILAWEKGKAAPRGQKLTSLIGVRTITTTEARERLGLPPVARKARKKRRKKKTSRKKK